LRPGERKSSYIRVDHMAEWLLAVVYVTATWAYQGIAVRRRRAGRTPPPLAFFLLAGIVAGAAIGDWWAPALATAGLPAAIALNRTRKPLRAREAVLGTLVDASMIAVGCALSRVF
jgi:ABC-type Mn2+/Zn2+ transport system permease subunit